MAKTEFHFNYLIKFFFQVKILNLDEIKFLKRFSSWIQFLFFKLFILLSVGFFWLTFSTILVNFMIKFFFRKLKNAKRGRLCVNITKEKKQKPDKFLNLSLLFFLILLGNVTIEKDDSVRFLAIQKGSDIFLNLTNFFERFLGSSSYLLLFLCFSVFLK